MSNIAALENGGGERPPCCTVELPKRAAEGRTRWVHAWHPTVLEETPEGLEGMLEELVMRFKRERAYYLEGMMALLMFLNQKSAPSA